MFNVKNITELKRQLPMHEKWLRGEDEGERLICSVGANLRGAELIGADLRRADLRRADLSVADLSVANLRGADLRGAELVGADLRGADLSGANLIGAQLIGAQLIGADLSGVELPVETICTWPISITEKRIRIGCEEKTATEWRAFFKSKKFISTDPESDPIEYELIRLAFKQAVIAQKMLKLRSND